MIKMQLAKSILLGTLVIGSVAYGSFDAHASASLKPSSGQNQTDNTLAMSSQQFYDILEKTEPNQVASHFGLPNKMIAMRNAAGIITGEMWIYHNAVNTQHTTMDANFMLVNGKFKYVTLSKPS